MTDDLSHELARRSRAELTVAAKLADRAPANRTARMGVPASLKERTLVVGPDGYGIIGEASRLALRLALSGFLVVGLSSCGFRPGALASSPKPATSTAHPTPTLTSSPAPEPTASPTLAAYDWVQFVCLAVLGQRDALDAVINGAKAIGAEDHTALAAARDAFHAAADPVVIAMPDSNAGFLDQPSAVLDLQNALLAFYSKAAEAFEQSVAAAAWGDVDEALWRQLDDLSGVATDAMEAALIRGMCP